MDADRLFQTVASILGKDKRIQVYSSLNQHLIEDPSIVLWDKTATSISDDIYYKFKQAIVKRTCNWYTLNKRLPYQDFCIALLCSVSYTLNHNTVPQVESRTFKSAWRCMSVLIAIGDRELQEWIKDRIQDRNSSKYCDALNINEPDSPTLYRKLPTTNTSKQTTIDENIMSKACSSKNIIEITPNSSLSVSSIMLKIVSTPECQLDNLRIMHKSF